MDLVDEGLVERRPRRLVAPPYERLVDHDALRHERRRVPPVGLDVLLFGADAIAEHRVVPVDRAVDALGERVDQQLVGVEPVTQLRPIWPVDPISVALAGPHVREVAVPDQVRLLDEPNALLVRAAVVEEAEVDGLGVLAEDREVDARAVPGRAEWIRFAAPDPQRHCCPGTRSGRQAIELTRRRLPSAAGRCGRHSHVHSNGERPTPRPARRSTAPSGSHSQSGRLLASYRTS